MNSTGIPNEDRDPEAVVLDVVLHYMNNANERARQRLMFHLQHKYFPRGDFVPQITEPIRLTPKDDIGRGPAPLPPTGPFAPPAAVLEAANQVPKEK